LVARSRFHHHLGPGLLESIYEAALCHELSRAGIGVVRQRKLKVKYQGVDLACDSSRSGSSKACWCWSQGVAQLPADPRSAVADVLADQRLPLGLFAEFSTRSG